MALCKGDIVKYSANGCHNGVPYTHYYYVQDSDGDYPSLIRIMDGVTEEVAYRPSDDLEKVGHVALFDSGDLLEGAWYAPRLTAKAKALMKEWM